MLIICAKYCRKLVRCSSSQNKQKKKDHIHLVDSF